MRGLRGQNDAQARELEALAVENQRLRCQLEDAEREARYSAVRSQATEEQLRAEVECLECRLRSPRRAARGGDADGDADGDEPVWSTDLSGLEQVADALDSPAEAPPLGPRSWSPPGLEDHFEPPDPPPVLGGDPIIVMGWIGLIGGLLIVFGWAMFGSLIPAWLARSGLVAIMAGAAALIWKMPHHRDPEDTDDGAQV
ncbi:MAG: hypothetical protein LBD77_00500 [Bifidobacteriaceae bacterium]|jgi:hypothetical protein|nr:hypothetical protein [Bifidobacteriaceae bacterium]